MRDSDRDSAVVAASSSSSSSAPSLPRLVAVEAEGRVVLWVALFAVVPAQFGSAVLIGSEIKLHADCRLTQYTDSC